jgi:hypothetical protein
MAASAVELRDAALSPRQELIGTGIKGGGATPKKFPLCLPADLKQDPCAEDALLVNQFL